MRGFLEPWDCLLNGANLQLEPLTERGRFRVRRKDGGAVIGEVIAADARQAIFLADSVSHSRESAEVLRILRPWLNANARMVSRVCRRGAQLGRGARRRRHRRLGLGSDECIAAGVWLERFGIAADHISTAGIDPMDEPALLHPVGYDRSGRSHWLEPRAAQAWHAMRSAANTDDVNLEVVSGFRSCAYQAAIFRRKLARGLSIERILEVNAAPGFSEHQSGRALDLTTPGCPPAEEAFEKTMAFSWLQRRAADFGFVLSYPRNNPQGFVYEPWHWCWRG